MLALSSLAFASPWLLVALAALPIIWWLLRVTPPTPRRIAFPAIRLLLGLAPREETPARTPLWLILLRMALAALVILAVAHPLLNPQPRLASTGPILIIVDDGWAAARDWTARQAALADLLAEAEREDRQVVLVATAPPVTNEPLAPLGPIRAADARAAVQALQPKPWPVDRRAALARLEALSLAGATSAFWLSDGVADDKSQALAAYLAERGSLHYIAAEPGQTPPLLAAGDLQANDLGVRLRSLPAPVPRLLQVRASAEDGRLLARQAATIEPGAKGVEVRLPMPSELRNRAARIEIEGDQSAGSVLLVDERWRRRPVGIAAATSAGGQPLLSENYYLERALGPFTEIRRGRTTDLLKRELAVLIFSDVGPDSPAEEAAIIKWTEAGGLLLRFAGPRLAEEADQLLPVRLRRGGRTIGGALSWEQPARLAPFAPDSPFAGLAVPADVTVSRQVLAEPDLELASKTWARLADGTPLVTAEKRGQGWIVLVHTTANADWSNLALSGLFVEMLRRTVVMSQGVAAASEEALPPIETFDGFGRLHRAPPDLGQGGGFGDRISAASARLLRHDGHQACAQSLGRDRGIAADQQSATRHHARKLSERPRDRYSAATAYRGAAFGAGRFADCLCAAWLPAKAPRAHDSRSARRGALRHLGGARRRRLCSAGDFRAALGLCADRERPGRYGQPSRAGRPDGDPEPTDRSRDRRAARRRHRAG